MSSLSVSNTVLPINALFIEMSNHIEFSKVYSDLDIQSIVTKFRANVGNDPLIDAPNIIFGFTRTPLKKIDVLGYRGRRAPVIRKSDNSISLYKSLYGEFTINYQVYFKSMSDLEEYEICMATNNGIASIHHIHVDLTEFNIGDFEYQIHWEELESIDIPDNDIYKFGITGSLTISGEFFSIDGETKPVKTIIFTIKDIEGTVYSTDIILSA